MAPQANQQVLLQSFRLFAFGLLLLELLSYFLHVSRMTVLGGDGMRTIVLALELMVILASAVMALLGGQYKAVAVFAALAFYVVFQANLFVYNFHTQLNINNQSAFFGWFSVLVFSVGFYFLPHRLVVKVLYAFSLGYAVLYLLMSLHFPGLTSPPGTVDALNIGADSSSGRSARIFMLSSGIAFGMYYSTLKLFFEKNLIYILPIALCVVDIYFSASRTMTAIVFGVLMLYFVLRNTRAVGVIATAVLFVVMGVLLLGLAYPDFQPFTMFGARDGSAVIRGLSYEGVRSYAPDHWLLGTGFPSSQTDVVYIMSSRIFFSSDLGAVGVFHEAGVVGVLLLAFLSLVTANSRGALDVLQIDQAQKEGLALTGVACALLGVIAPDVWTGSSTLFVGFFLAVGIVAQRVRGSQMRTRRNDVSAGAASPAHQGPFVTSRAPFTPR